MPALTSLRAWASNAICFAAVRPSRLLLSHLGLRFGALLRRQLPRIAAGVAILCYLHTHLARSGLFRLGHGDHQQAVAIHRLDAIRIDRRAEAHRPPEPQWAELLPDHS